MRDSILLIFLIAIITASNAHRVGVKVDLEKKEAQDDDWNHLVDDFLFNEDEAIETLQIKDMFFGNNVKQKVNDFEFEEYYETTNGFHPLAMDEVWNKDALEDPLKHSTSMWLIDVSNEASENSSLEIVENLIPNSNSNTNLNNYNNNNNNDFKPRRVGRIVGQEEIEQLTLSSINKRKEEISHEFKFKPFELSCNKIGFAGAFFNIKNATFDENFLKFTKLGSIGKLISSQGIIASDLIISQGKGDEESNFDIIYRGRNVGKSKDFLQKFKFYLNLSISNDSPIQFYSIIMRLTSEGQFPALWTQFTSTGKLVAANLLPHHLALYIIRPYGIKEIGACSLEINAHDVEQEKAVALMTFEAKDEFEKINWFDLVDTPVNDLWVAIWKQIGHVIGAELILLPIAHRPFYI